MPDQMPSFATPPVHFRGFPFWAWNGRLDEERLRRQVATFQAMGFGGAMPHVRWGLTDDYLGERFRDCIVATHAAARECGLLLPLYDEDRWPSGFAGGLVTREERFRQRECLILPDAERPEPGGDAVGQPGPATCLARWRLQRDADGRLRDWQRLPEEEPVAADAEVWRAWSRHVQRSWRFNGYTRVDALSPAAMQRFVAITHERYREWLGGDFGRGIPFIFSDEPQIGHHGRFRSSAVATAETEPTEDVPERIQHRASIPWTEDLPASWRERFGSELMELMPALLWDSVDGRSERVRWCWFDHLGERFAAAWTGVPAAWCEQHGLPMTGHMCAENRLTTQILIDADVMRALAPMQYPGVDLLCDWWEPNTLKQASSLAHQYGRERVMTELYGVNRWDWPLIGHKRQGDWQYALGANLRVPHLAWYSMAGEAKRDYPQPIDGHAPWARAYGRIEDHFARLGYALTRGEPLIRVAVVHPLESAWLEMGPVDSHAVGLNEREHRFAELSDWLIGGLVDFDFLAESLLEDLLGAAADGAVQVGRMRYNCIVLPDLSSLRPATLRACQRLLDAGGRVLLLGRMPTLIEGGASEEPAALAQRCERLPWDRRLLLQALSDLREVAVDEATSGAFPWLVHQIRRVDDERLVFCCNRSNEEQACDLNGAILRVRGTWAVTRCDTTSGKRSAEPVAHRDGWTLIPLDLPRNASVLYACAPTTVGSADLPPPVQALALQAWRLAQPEASRLSESNVLLLDHGRWRLDDGAWDDCEDVLLLDADLRARLEWTPAIAQPWCVTATAAACVWSASSSPGRCLWTGRPCRWRPTAGGWMRTCAAGGCRTCQQVVMSC
ncbi:MAG: glycosyl hydrolase [Planctomycetota bacterium]